jgi:hypothetical protein
MHLTAPLHWSRSIGTNGRDPSELVVTIAGMRILIHGITFDRRLNESFFATLSTVAIHGTSRSAELAIHSNTSTGSDGSATRCHRKESR